MVFSRVLIYMESVHNNLDSMVQERIQGISQEESQFSIKYEVGDILDDFLMSDMWYI